MSDNTKNQTEKVVDTPAVENNDLADKVGNTKSAHITHKSHAMWGVLLLGALVMAVVVWSGKKVTPSDAPDPIDMTLAESNNLKVLHKKVDSALAESRRTKIIERERQTQDAPDHFSPAITPQSDVGITKEMKARMNMGMVIYSAKKGDNPRGQGTGSEDHPPQQKIATATISGLAQTDAYSDFANSQAQETGTVDAKQLPHPETTIAEGDFIHATLETAINSDLPGKVRAVVSRPVYGYIGDKPLISAGSRLIGQYASIAGNGAATARVFIIWNRVITPTGVSILINSPSSDTLGRSGQGADDIDSHFVKIFGTSTLLSVIGATVNSAGSNSNGAFPSTQDAYRFEISRSFDATAKKVLSDNLSIKPTIHINQGNAINVFVAHDLDFYGVMHQDTHHSEHQQDVVNNTMDMMDRY